MAVFNTKPYLKYILHASLLHHAPKEDVTYPVISEFISEHKNPPDRFVIYPQISLLWKPHILNDTRAEVPDFALGNFTHQAPYFKLRIGAEVKRCIQDSMSDFPSPLSIERNPTVMAAFHALFFQGEDQAKAAIKGGQTFSNSVAYLLFVGPYWTPVKYGPFAEAELGVRTHKPSGSGDFGETLKARKRLASNPISRRLYLLGTAESSEELERMISSTDHFAEKSRYEAAHYLCKPIKSTRHFSKHTRVNIQ
jgi:hypothetical protein